jgi:tyrosine-protein phosphatase SIW14
MRVNRMPIRPYALAVLVALSVAVPTTAQPRPPAANPVDIRIDNFGKISDTYYRGAQPNDSDYLDLAALGVRTVIDLTRDGRPEESELVERAGMKFYRIPMTTSDRPADEAIERFLKLVNDPLNQPVYVHCQGGRHRTGVMTAVYRMTHDGWTADRSYQEMKQFNFEGFPGHPTLKHFVYDYYAQIERPRVAATPVPVVTVATK